MLFNEYQSRLWLGMIKSIEDFRKGESRYYDFVGELEGALDIGEFQNKELINQWYDFWTPLEILRAQKGNSVTIEEVNKYLFDMEAFLRSIPMVFRLDKQQFDYFNNLFNQQEILEFKLQITMKDQFFYIETDEDSANDIRDRLGEELQKRGFDVNYKLTFEGEILEDLIDVFYC